MRLKVFISGPYSGDVEGNVANHVQKVDELLDEGFAPYTLLLFHYANKRPYEDWLILAMEWLRACDALLRLPGESPGADNEVARAKELGIPVFNSMKELVDWRTVRDGKVKHTFTVEVNGVPTDLSDATRLLTEEITKLISETNDMLGDLETKAAKRGYKLGPSYEDHISLHDLDSSLCREVRTRVERIYDLMRSDSEQPIFIDGNSWFSAGTVFRRDWMSSTHECELWGY